MIKNKQAFFILFFLASLISTSLLSQPHEMELYIPLEIKETYQKKTRDLSGKPGPAYWQNHVQYKIDVELDPANFTYFGSEIIFYKNNSPDTLAEITITMLGDIYNKTNYNHDWGMNRDLMTEGILIDEVKINNNNIDVNGNAVRRSGTNMFIKLDKPLLPGKQLELFMKWTFFHPEKINIREGHYGDSTFFAGHFYPRVAVYDDIDGWDKKNYTGYAEFYGQYADYEVNITVPGGFIVWATGELQNAREVLSGKYLDRWNQAHEPGQTINIIRADEVFDRDITQPGEKLTWKFVASNVPDFAFATSDKFRWDARTVMLEDNRKVLLNTAYARDRIYYPRIINLLDTVITNFSTQMPGIPYPYPVMTIFNGQAGMEYPMMCNDAEIATWAGNVVLTYHEVAHSYFPFMVGTNERKYAWMDEGWANFFPKFFVDQHVKEEYDYLEIRFNTYARHAGREAEVPIITLTDHLRIRWPYRQASYDKSFIANYYLFEYLGEERFLACLREYISRWEGKHPMPYDFFFTFNDVSQENLNWFWKSWYFDPGYPDLAIRKKDEQTVIIENVGKLPLPVKLTIFYSDDSFDIIEYDMKVWANSVEKIEVPLKTDKTIRNIVLGDQYIVDIDLENNILFF
jgi:hypothetical protein